MALCPWYSIVRIWLSAASNSKLWKVRKIPGVWRLHRLPAGSRDSVPMGVQGAKPPKNFERRALGGLKMSYHPDSTIEYFKFSFLMDFHKNTDDWKHWTLPNIAYPDSERVAFVCRTILKRPMCGGGLVNSRPASIILDVRNQDEGKRKRSSVIKFIFLFRIQHLYYFIIMDTKNLLNKHGRQTLRADRK